MAVTQNSYTGNGSTTQYSFTFPYLKSSEVKASIDATVTTAFTLANATTVQFNTAPANGAKIKIYRETDSDSLAATFYAGSAIKAEDLNDNFTQNLYTTQEVSARYISNLGGTMTGDLILAEDVKITFEGATDNAHETTLTVADPTADRTITLPNVSGTVVTTGDTGTVTSAMLAAGTIDTDDLAANSVTTVKITDSNVTTAKIADDAITSAKIGNDQVDSEHYAADSIDTEHYAPNSVDTTALAADAVTGAQIANDAIDSEHLVADSIDTEHYAPASVDTTALANTSVTTAKIANDAVTGSQIADNAITSDQMSSNSVLLAHMTDNSVGTTELVNDSVTNAKIAAGAIDITHIDGSALIVQSEQASTTGNDTTLLTSSASDARYFKQDSTETINSGQTWSSSDNYVATTGAINARIVDLVNDVGGFITIDNETVFPDTNPDPQNAAGTIISIKGLTADLVTGSGETTKTIGNGNVSNNATITITGLTESTTYGEGMGLLVETTSTTHTYTFHRLVPPPTSITTVSNNIASVTTTANNIANVNSFADKYRVASSAPTSNNDEGDLYYDTAVNKLYVYDGSNWQVAASMNGSGGTVTADTTFTDNTKLKLGTGEDLKIYHDATQSLIEGTAPLYIKGSPVVLYKGGTTEKFFEGVADGASKLYYDGTKKFETTSSGWKSGDNVKGVFGDGNDLEIYSTGTNGWVYTPVSGADLYMGTNAGEVYIVTGASGNDTGIKVVSDGAVELYYDDSKKAETHANGLNVNGRLYVTSHINLDDNTSGAVGKLLIGGGDDLQIYHDGSHSRIHNDTGHLLIETDAASAIEINKGTSENLAKFIPDGAVELYYDSSKKLETTADGVTVNGDLNLQQPSSTTNYIQWDNSEGKLKLKDDIKITVGDGEDLVIYHDGSNSYIRDEGTGKLLIDTNGTTLQLRTTAGEEMVSCYPNAAVELYYDNSKKFETNSEGVQIHGKTYAEGSIDMPDDAKLLIGNSDDLEIFHNGYNSKIADVGTGALILSGNVVKIENGASSETQAVFTEDGAVELYYDNSKKLETTSTGATITPDLILNGSGDTALRWAVSGTNKWSLYNSTATLKLYDNVNSAWRVSFTGANIDIPDSTKVRFGTGNDLEIYHSSHSYIDNNNGSIYIRNNVDDWNADHIFIEPKSGESSAKFLGDGAVELYYDNAKKLNTASGGVTVTGQLWASADVMVPDGAKLKAGDGEDLEIYHSSGSSYLHNNTGRLRLESDNLGIGFYKGAGSEYLAMFNVDAECSLYYNNSKKFETHSGGINVTGSVNPTGNVALVDDSKLKLGTGDDLQIYHSGHSIVQNTNAAALLIASDETHVLNNAMSETQAKFINNGAVELYYDNVKQINTTSTGVTLGDDKRIDFGDGADLKIFHDGSYNKIESSGSTALLIRGNGGTMIGDAAGNKMIQTEDGGTTELYYDGTKKLDTSSTGPRVYGNLRMEGDDRKIILGDGSDLQIYHDGTDSYITNTTGELKITDSSLIRFNTDDLRVYKGNGTELTFRAEGDGACSLYYDNSKKLETTADGVKITDDGGYQLTLNRSGSAADQAGLLFLDGTDEYARIHSWSGNIALGVGVGSGAYEDAVQCNKNGEVRFHYDGSEKCRTGSAGLLVNRTTNDGNAALQISETGNFGISVATATTSERTMCEFKNPNGQVGTITSNASQTNFNTSSDYRLKENEIAISDGITRLKTLKPYRFNFKTNPDVTVDGFFAHEVTAVPEAVSGEKDGEQMQGVDYGRITPLLTAALQEAIEKIETLETKIAALESS